MNTVASAALLTRLYPHPRFVYARVTARPQGQVATRVRVFA